MRLQPGADIAKALKSGDTLECLPGAYRGGATITGQSGFKLILTGATLTGGVNGLKFVNCHDFQVIGGESHGAQNYGWFLQGCKTFTFTGTKATNAGTSGFLTTHVTDANFLGCTARGSRDQHGLYVSEKAAKVRIIGGDFSLNGRAGIQINADKGGANDVEIRDLKAEHNQGGPSGGAAAIQLAYVDGGRVLNCDILDHCGRAGIALFWKTRNVTVDQCLIQFAAGHGTANVSMDKTAQQNSIGNLNRYDARVKPVVREGQ